MDIDWVWRFGWRHVWDLVEFRGGRLEEDGGKMWEGLDCRRWFSVLNTFRSRLGRAHLYWLSDTRLAVDDWCIVLSWLAVQQMVVNISLIQNPYLGQFRALGFAAGKVTKVVCFQLRSVQHLD